MAKRHDLDAKLKRLQEEAREVFLEICRDRTCHDCGAKEGEFHQRGCDMERCPFCGGQLISCNCLTPIASSPRSGMGFVGHPTSGLPKDVYKDGPPEQVLRTWEEMLEAIW